ncbi:MAG: type I secretion system permease/ATPase [Oxalobacteraceae bacterium]
MSHASLHHDMADVGDDARAGDEPLSGNITPEAVEETLHRPKLPSGLACLLAIARSHGIAVDAGQLMHEFGGNAGAFGSNAILHSAHKLGLSAKSRRIPAARLHNFPLPAIATDIEGNFFVIVRIDSSHAAMADSNGDGRVLIVDPEAHSQSWITMEDFRARWNGELILFASHASLALEAQRFDFTWFIPAVVKYRKLLLEVLLVSVALQLFGLVTPLFFQVVMDKVLVHHGFSTLDVIAIGLLVVGLFEVSLSALRTYVFSHTCSRIDVELGSKLFSHLLSLPLPWFHARRAGDSVARVRELENIRSFLTGNGITLVLDLMFSVIFIGVMLFYSATLTLIVVLSLPCYLMLSIAATPILRQRLDEKFRRSAENQAFLVETVNAIDTVKALAVEPRWRRKWENQLAAYLQAAFRAGNVGNWASNLVSLIGKLVTVATMWMGARLVIEGQLTVGQLVAFNMLAGHVATPVIRLAQMWSDFQQVGVSVQRLGDILNTDTEKSSSGTVLPPVRGRIDFDHLNFRYRPDGKETLSDIHLSIRPGEVIGIVGRSGSGKSTLTRLLQRLMLPSSGRILVDGVDIALADPASLRRQIGVVLQESQLFNGTIRENIALADPGAPLEEVIRVACLAGAHAFISELPEGYDTVLGEHGTGLSGGQKQRIAIARALMRDPRILIFDEATSALDYQSERIIQTNMAAICQGRTVIIIAHRLTAVRQADRILVLEQGRLVEQGRHDELLQRQDGFYHRLHSMQMA